MDQMKKVRLPGKSTHYIDGEEIYALQIRKLAVGPYFTSAINSLKHGVIS
jgi:hypothetical protein